MVYYLYVGAGIPVGGYVLLHIIYQEMLSSRSTNLPAFFIPRRWEQQYLLFHYCSTWDKVCQEFLQKTGKICIRIKNSSLFGRELANEKQNEGRGILPHPFIFPLSLPPSKPAF